MNHARFGFASLLAFALVGLSACAADATSTDDDATTPEPEMTEHVSMTRTSLVGLDSTKYCLPGEVVKCTLGPPPVCHCEPTTTTTTTTATTMTTVLAAP